MTTTNEATPRHVTIRIDAKGRLGQLHRSEKYINTSLRFVPPPWLMRQASQTFGRFRIARVFLTLDEFWDYRDDTYHPNYRIGHNRYASDTTIHPYDRERTKPSEVHYQDYLDAVAAEADNLLLCVRRYEHEVTGGIICREKYEQVLTHAVRKNKLRHPNLRYLEALNESTNAHFGGLNAEAYYAFYRSFYRVANRVNAERLPGPAIEVGGPVTDKKRFNLVEDFLNHFRDDRDPAKRLDFVSFHDYASGDRPARVAELRKQLDRFLINAGLPLNLQTFMTEMGTHEGKDGSNSGMAAGVPALFEQVRRQHDMVAFPWLWSTQHLTDGRMTPHGMR
ncbi:MAG TPA: hypothetical protein VGN72_17385 [Tepidisphaeraceae bacterium]|nr:hypothetical protein [Tepidisphaeraceae bacterium]